MSGRRVPGCRRRRVEDLSSSQEIFSTTGVATRLGHGKTVVTIVPSPAAIPKFVRQQSVFSVHLPTGVSPNFWRNLDFVCRKYTTALEQHHIWGSAKWLAEPLSWRDSWWRECQS